MPKSRAELKVGPYEASAFTPRYVKAAGLQRRVYAAAPTPPRLKARLYARAMTDRTVNGTASNPGK